MCLRGIMTFDLYSGESNECIEHHEEVIFRFVNPVNHPQLSRMKECFYQTSPFSLKTNSIIGHHPISWDSRRPQPPGVFAGWCATECPIIVEIPRPVRRINDL